MPVNKGKAVSDATKSRWIRQIEFLNSHVENLNEWEATFVESVHGTLMGRGYDLSQKQSAALGKIFKKIQEKLG